MATTLGSYYVVLKDHSGIQVALFDDWQSLAYTKEVNGLGEYKFVINGDDDRVTLFGLDYQFEVWRSVPGMGVDWYLDFEGFHRKQERQITDDGKSIFISSGLGYNDLLGRTVIGYKEGTIRAEKSAPAETVMKEYVSENCTAAADDFSVVGRLNYDEHWYDETGAIVYYAELPGFSVEGDLGRGQTWEGERAYENLLSTLQDIANDTGIDFNVIGTGPATFEFKVYPDGIGENRSATDIQSSGLNIYGNSPVLFCVYQGTISQITYIEDRTKEINAVMILGKGDVSLREVYTQANTDAQSESPWNRREVTRPGSNQEFIAQFNQLAFEVLADNAAKIDIDTDPMQTQSHCYGLHYSFGDIITIRCNEIVQNRKITKVSITVANKKETIRIVFAEYVV